MWGGPPSSRGNVPTRGRRVADLDFHSTSYDWLVIAGAKAQYKGSGTINGTGDYAFQLSGVDGQVNGSGGGDRFRMKIMSKTTGSVIYDNQLGAADTSAASTVIGGGSIVIHTTLKGANAASAQAEEGGTRVGVVPVAYAMAQNAPNPFSEGTQIAFELPEQGHVRLTVYDLAGREIAALANEARGPGLHVVSWSGRRSDGSAARGGVYFVRIVAESLRGTRHFTSFRKMIRVD